LLIIMMKGDRLR